MSSFYTCVRCVAVACTFAVCVLIFYLICCVFIIIVCQFSWRRTPIRFLRINTINTDFVEYSQFCVRNSIKHLNIYTNIAVALTPIDLLAYFESDIQSQSNYHMKLVMADGKDDKEHNQNSHSNLANNLLYFECNGFLLCTVSTNWWNCFSREVSHLWGEQKQQ